MPESARRLLTALIMIENREVAIARASGCTCSAPVPGMEDEELTYPYASFDRANSVGKPFDQIVWQIQHEPECPMSGQTGIG